MKTLNKLGNRLYLDTNIFIYAVEGNATFRSQVASLFSYIDNPDILVIGNQTLLTELLVQPYKTGNTQVADIYLQMLDKNTSFKLVDIDRNTALKAVQIRADYGLKSIDAIHIASAIVHGCTAFISNDQRLSRVTEIPCFGLGDLDD